MRAKKGVCGENEHCGWSIREIVSFLSIKVADFRFHFIGERGSLCWACDGQFCSIIQFSIKKNQKYGKRRQETIAYMYPEGNHHCPPHFYSVFYFDLNTQSDLLNLFHNFWTTAGRNVAVNRMTESTQYKRICMQPFFVSTNDGCSFTIGKKIFCVFFYPLPHRNFFEKI